MWRKLVNCAIGLGSVVLVSCTSIVNGDEHGQSNRSTVERYVGAFNACDIDSAAGLMHDDIEWLSIADAGVDTVSAGKANLVSESRAYMANGCSTQSVLSDWSVNGPFVTVIETAKWRTTDGQARSQSATAVYEVRDLKVRRVWYFPEVK